ncbi:MAG: type III polyketide synthase [Deltaproteobacteria bacterium]
MAKIVSVGIADIPYQISQSEAKEFIRSLFSDYPSHIERIIGVFDSSGIATRYFAEPPEWFAKPRGFRERNESYIKSAVKFSAEAAVRCVEAAGGQLSDIDHLIFVSSTGIATPSVDAHIINHLKLRANIKRTPIWGLGCVGGAVGLTRAFEYVSAYPQSAALVIALEICGMAFHKDDISKSNLVATALFADGAAAALVAGGQNRLHQNRGALLRDALSTIYPNSLDVMGWEIADDGFKVIFSRDIPDIVRRYARDTALGFLLLHGLQMSQIEHFVIHPGGPKVIAAYEESLGLRLAAMRHSRQVLSRRGNMSSPTVLYVLREFLDSGEYEGGDLGLISALGPGFSSEFILFEVS